MKEVPKPEISQHGDAGSATSYGLRNMLTDALHRNLPLREIGSDVKNGLESAAQHIRQRAWGEVKDTLKGTLSEIQNTIEQHHAINQWNDEYGQFMKGLLSGAMPDEKIDSARAELRNGLTPLRDTIQADIDPASAQEIKHDIMGRLDQIYLRAQIQSHETRNATPPDIAERAQALKGFISLELDDSLYDHNPSHNNDALLRGFAEKIEQLEALPQVRALQPEPGSEHERIIQTLAQARDGDPIELHCQDLNQPYAEGVLHMLAYRVDYELKKVTITTRDPETQETFAATLHHFTAAGQDHYDLTAPDGSRSSIDLSNLVQSTWLAEGEGHTLRATIDSRRLSEDGQ